MEKLTSTFSKSFEHRLAIICFAISIIALLPFTYSFYVLIRLVFFIAALWCGWQLYLRDDRIGNIHFVIAGLAILYNPIFLVHIGSKLLWLIINLGTSFFILKISDQLFDGQNIKQNDLKKAEIVLENTVQEISKKEDIKPEKSTRTVTAKVGGNKMEANYEGLPIFKLTLGKTYFKQGFFNVGVDFERYVTKSDEELTIYVGSQKQTISGRSSRKYNNNGTPRIFGSTSLRDWFQNNFEMMDTVDVKFISPTKVWLTKPS